MKRFATITTAGLLLTSLTGCNPAIFPGNVTGEGSGATTPGAVLTTNGAFAQNLVLARTLTAGVAVTTITHAAGDMERIPLGIDFNLDGKLDPVAGYGDSQAVIQILLSNGPVGTVNFVSLTLDSKRDMENLADVAVGDIDGDGYLDIVAASTALWYFHHPSSGVTSDLPAWGNQDPADELREKIESSANVLSDDELEEIILQALGPGVNLDDYVVAIEQSFTNVEVGDLNDDGDNDIAASRRFEINLTPRPGLPVEPISILDGDVMVFLNPGSATDGRNWAVVSAGRHERHLRLDRDGANGLLLHDLDQDGDLDLVSAARDDNNAQVAWFENPGAPLDPSAAWVQWRVGSVRGAWGLDIVDVTSDGRPDVVASGSDQQQLLLFVQPETGPKRTFDWDTHVLATFENFEPRDVKVFDIDGDGVVEIISGASAGAVRYFETSANPLTAWSPVVLTDFDPPGDVGYLGYGDLDGDGDLDLVTVLNSDEDNAERIVWIRNDLP